MMPLLEVRSLEHRYPSGVIALQGVSLALTPGATAIVGENGAGKTTLVKHFNGLLRPTAGEVLMDGRTIARRTVADLAGTVGLVFQNPNDQIFNATVWTETAFGPRNLGFDEERITALVEQALDLVGLRGRGEEGPYGLTLSERKLLCIASVIAMDTPVVVLDEPTTGQDQRGVRQIGAIVDHLRRAGRTVVAITHDMGLVADAFERTVVMAGGRVALDGETRSIFGHPDVLAACGVEPPPITRLAQRLGLPGTPLGVTEFVATYRQEHGARPVGAGGQVHAA